MERSGSRALGMGVLICAESTQDIRPLSAMRVAGI
jgi:hypothetical protein